MMKVGKMRKLWDLRRTDFLLAMIALTAVLVMPTLQALALAVVASLAILIWRASEPRLSFMGRAPGGLESVDLQSAPEAAVPGLLIVRPDEMLFFANVTSVRDRILKAAEDAEPSPSVVLVDLGLTPEADIPVVEALEDLHGRLAADGIELWLCRVRPSVRALLDRGGVLEHIGVDHIHPREIEGIVAFVARMPGALDREAILSDLLAFVRERRARPGTSAAAIELMDALEQRIASELRVTGRGS
jgi:SulP family sulfate permease